MKCLFNIIAFCFGCISLLGQIQFEETSQQIGLNHYFLSPNLMGGGSAFFDFNKDGLDDVWINGGSVPDKLFQNNGDGTFEDITAASGVLGLAFFGSSSVISGDVNNDGHKDIFIGTINNRPNRLFLNTGTGGFVDITESAGFMNETGWTTSVAFADINLDGYLDVYTGNYIEDIGIIYENGEVVGFDHTCMTDNIYLNNGDLTFQKMDDSFWPNQAGCVLASAFTDYDMDGDPDLMIANDFGEWVVPNRLFNNNHPELSMTEVGDQNGANPGLYGMGIAIGDYDLDEDMDYYVTNLGRNVLLNNQDLLFNDLATEAGVEDTQHNGLNTVGWGTSFEDINLDMYPDLLVANGHISAAEFIATNPVNPNKMYINNQDGTFADVSIESAFADGKIARGLSCSDIDNDGDIDILVMNITGLVQPGEEGNIALYRNLNNNQNNWVKITLEGTVNNRDAYGSMVRCYVDGKVLIRELNGGSSHASQNSSTIHFGLAQNEQIDSLSVTWPGGKIQTIQNPGVNQTHHILEDIELYTGIIEPVKFEFNIYPNPASEYLAIDSKETVLSFVITDGLGRSVLTGDGNYVKLNSFHPGIYIIQVETVSGKSQRSFVVR